MKHKKILTATILVVSAIIIGFVGYWAGQIQTDETNNGTAEGPYPLLAARTQLGNGQYQILNFVELRAKLNEIADKHKNDVGIYFEYLPTGTSIEVDADQKLISASLLKVPIAMDALKLAELGMIDLNQRITITEDNLDLTFGDIRQYIEGDSITLAEAIEYMLIKSDNTALRIVEDAVFNKLYEVQGYTVVDIVDIEYTTEEIKSNQADQTLLISSEEYASVFKCLYFSCYLSQASSNQLLSTLSRTDFDQALLGSGVPAGANFAHKVGVHNNELYRDCGIVYPESRHYLLCVAVKAGPKEASDVMEQISSEIYQYVSGYGLQVN